MRGFALNIARSLNSGVDFEFAYETPLFDGNLSANLIGTYLLEAKDYPFADKPENYTDYAGVTGDQDLQMQLRLGYRVGAWSFGTNTRYLNGVELYTADSLERNPNPSN